MKKSTILLIVSIAVVAIGIAIWPAKPPAEKRVAIATLMSHPALNDVDTGLREELERRGWVEGENIEFITRNANQQMQVLPAIAGDLASQNVDVIVGITTPMAQALARVIKSPLVFAAVTDPVKAGLVPDLTNGHVNITGTSDAWPYRAQLALIREILPNAKMLGVLYNPGEAASQYGIEQIRLHAPSFNFELTESGVNTVVEVRPAAEGLAERVDALFLSSDNTVIGGMNGALSVAVEQKKALFVGDSGTVQRGGLAAVSVGYLELGRKTGELVDRMLRGERSIPTVVSMGEEIYINLKAAELMQVEVPQALIDRASKVFQEIGE